MGVGRLRELRQKPSHRERAKSKGRELCQGVCIYTKPLRAAQVGERELSACFVLIQELMFDIHALEIRV